MCRQVKNGYLYTEKNYLPILEISAAFWAQKLFFIFTQGKHFSMFNVAKNFLGNSKVLCVRKRKITIFWFKKMTPISLSINNLCLSKVRWCTYSFFEIEYLKFKARAHGYLPMDMQITNEQGNGKWIVENPHWLRDHTKSHLLIFLKNNFELFSIEPFWTNRVEFLIWCTKCFKEKPLLRIIRQLKKIKV